jgi:double-stranded uracil-DNA glycosylase
VGFTRAELEACRGRSVPDVLGDDVRLLFVGINPGLWTAAAQAHFAKRGNRFYPALFAAGLTGYLVDASAGFHTDDLVQLTSRGIGITNLVNRATARADELSVDELRRGRAELERKVALIRPAVVVIMGISAYRVAFDRPRATSGWQPENIAGAKLMVVGNPSGLNAHLAVGPLAEAFRQAAIAAALA